ncbi:hypothetical protein LJC39_00275 [Parabacteroides sp. OttesenSCG-928-B22]|nr:hypothetical protein [Parabacteroides sp. OttesenSCG-928-B22]
MQTISFMRNTLLVSLILLFTATSCGVYNKDSYVKSFESFIVGLEKKESFTEEEWEKIGTRFVEYSETHYEEYKDKLTSADRKKIGELRARYLKFLTIHHIEKAGKSLKDLGEEAAGFLKELTQ